MGDKEGLGGPVKTVMGFCMSEDNQELHPQNI